jgi:hypothetical protein
MDLSRLQELKRRLVHDKDFMKVWEFFLDEFATDLAFIELGEPVRDEPLETTIAHVGLQMFPRDATATLVRLIRLADQQFVHGNVNVAGRVGGVLYFEDIRVGLVAVCDHLPSDETKFARFSTMPYKPGGKPSRN